MKEFFILGRVLRSFRSEKGLTQEELAARIEIDPAYVSRMENGKKQPSFAMLIKLAQALDVKLSKIIIAMEQDTK